MTLDNIRYMDDEICVCCGVYVPDGSMVCQRCLNDNRASDRSKHSAFPKLCHTDATFDTIKLYNT